MRRGKQAECVCVVMIRDAIRLFGQPVYEDMVAPYLKSPNSIGEGELADNGTDKIDGAL